MPVGLLCVFESFVVIVLCFSCEAQRQLLVSVEISVNILCIVVRVGRVTFIEDI